MKRRDFIILAGGVVTWPLAVWAQESGRVRRVGVLLPGATDDAEYLDRVAAFRERLTN